MRRLALQVAPQPLLPTHPLPAAKPTQPGLALFSSCSDKTQLCQSCWETLRWLWMNSFCLSSCRLQALMSRQWHHGHQTAFGDELRVCFCLLYSECTNWVKDCSGNLFNQSWDFWVDPGYFGHFLLIFFWICFVQVEHDIFLIGFDHFSVWKDNSFWNLFDYDWNQLCSINSGKTITWRQNKMFLFWFCFQTSLKT